MTVAGDVSDYDAPTQAELTARLATALAVDAAAVSLNVTAASVHLLFAVQVAGSAEAAAVVAQVDRIMPTADATTSALGISVLSSPFVVRRTDFHFSYRSCATAY